MEKKLLITACALVVAFGIYTMNVNAPDTRSNQGEAVNQTQQQGAVKEAPPPEPEKVSLTVTALDEAGALSEGLAAHSPTLSADEKLSISQGYHGAPLSSAPSVHMVTADSLTCHRTVMMENAQPDCTVQYSKDSSARVSDENAAMLYAALQKIGLQEDAGAGQRYLRVTEAHCMIDDQKIQTSPGNNVEGFSCTFSVEKELAPAQ